MMTQDQSTRVSQLIQSVNKLGDARKRGAQHQVAPHTFSRIQAVADLPTADVVTQLEQGVYKKNRRLAEKVSDFLVSGNLNDLPASVALVARKDKKPQGAIQTGPRGGHYIEGPGGGKQYVKSLGILGDLGICK